MTRLFIRFYLGVLFILFCAWSIQAFVFRQRSEAANIQVVEQALGGGARLACQKLAESSPLDRAAALEELQRHFDYPLRVVAGDEIPQQAKDRFSQGDRQVVLVGRDGVGFVVAPIGGDEALEFGPLPSFVGPSQPELMTGLGLILLLAGAAIALLLRPVARQFRLVEQTAAAIAAGDFSARVDERKVSSATTLAIAFNNMASHTETMLRTQRELLQAVSHELRTPLSRIHFAIDLIRDAKDERQRDERLHSLETAAQDLDDLVGELLRYVRLETSEPPLEIADVELLPLVEDLIEKQSLTHAETRFEIDESLSAGPIALRADRASLERALGNLMGNAGRFATARVRIGASQTASGVTIDVDDDGPGIPLPDRLRVFDPFVRLDTSQRGVGLGLALVRRIVVNHGGSVAIEDSPLGGCRVRSVWPRAGSPGQPGSPTTAPPKVVSAT